MGLTPIVPMEGHVVEELVRRVEEIVKPVQLAARVGQATTAVHQGVEALGVDEPHLVRPRIGQKGGGKIGGKS